MLAPLWSSLRELLPGDTMISNDWQACEVKYSIDGRWRAAVADVAIQNDQLTYEIDPLLVANHGEQFGPRLRALAQAKWTSSNNTLAGLRSAPSASTGVAPSSGVAQK